MTSICMRIACIAACALCSVSASASQETVLYSFTIGAVPTGQPTLDSKGAIYGTAEYLDGYGAVYQLKQKHGKWNYKSVLDFSVTDGEAPYAGPLMDVASGSLFGTTIKGGDSGYGTVFSLAPAGKRWTETVLHSFTYSDGVNPYAVLQKDETTRNLYGTANYGGSYDCGTAFQLAQENGFWVFTKIYDFKGGSDACYPITQLVPGSKPGTLIGAALAPSGIGQVFQLTLKQGVWRDSIIYKFSGGADGGYPYDLVASGEGAIYGVTEQGGQSGNGVVFKLSPKSKKYTYSVLHDFGGGSDGAVGIGINLDPTTGNLYGTTVYGGTSNVGTLFMLAPSGNAWTEVVLHSFSTAGDGYNPGTRPSVDPRTGALYGTTQNGGANGGGILYMVQP